MAIPVLVIYGNEMCTQLVKSVIASELPPVMLVVAMAMER